MNILLLMPHCIPGTWQYLLSSVISCSSAHFSYFLHIFTRRSVPGGAGSAPFESRLRGGSPRYSRTDVSANVVTAWIRKRKLKRNAEVWPALSGRDSVSAHFSDRKKATQDEIHRLSILWPWLARRLPSLTLGEVVAREAPAEPIDMRAVAVKQETALSWLEYA